MRIDFNVLWVEDQQDNVQSQRVAIDRRIRAEGFRLDVLFADSVVQAVKALSESVYGDHIDLILMDYDLGKGGKGDEGLIEVRRIFEYKDLVFYSADPSKLAEIVAAKKIEGVFCSSRDHLPDEVFGLFETLIKKVLDIDHARGIVMGSTSDIDGLVFDSLDALFHEGGGKLSEGAKKILATQLDEIRSTCDKDAKKLALIDSMPELRKMHRHYSSVHRHRLLRYLLEQTNKYAELCAAMTTYEVETSAKRNELAHVRVEKKGFERKLYDKERREITREAVRDLQRELLKHQEALEKFVAECRQA
jgi:CheY-like chemotaxis protein